MSRGADNSPWAKLVNKIDSQVKAFNSMYGRNDACYLRLSSMKDYRIDKTLAYYYGKQYTLDLVSIALREEFGFNTVRQKRFCERFQKVWNEFQEIQKQEAPKTTLLHGKEVKYTGDKDMEYTIEKLEERVKASVGDCYCPREDRYVVEITYNGKSEGHFSTADEIKQRY